MIFHRGMHDGQQTKVFVIGCRTCFNWTCAFLCGLSGLVNPQAVFNEFERPISATASQELRCRQRILKALPQNQSYWIRAGATCRSISK